MSAIVVQPEGAEPKLFSERFLIGTGSGCALRIEGDAYVSVTHAVCYPSGSYWLIEDYGSVNGTWLDDRRVTGSLVIAKGDRIRVGNTTLTFVPAAA